MYLASGDCRIGMEVHFRDWDDLVSEYGICEDKCVEIKLTSNYTWTAPKGSQFLHEGSLTVSDVYCDPNRKCFFLTLDGWSDVALEASPYLPGVWFSQYELKRADAETNNIQFEEDSFLRMLGVREGS